MNREFQQIVWDEALVDDCRQIVQLAVREDLSRWYDVTTLALLPPESQAAAIIAARTGGVICGLKAAELALQVMETSLTWTALIGDGDAVTAGDRVAEIRGSARDLLTAERLLLNLIGRLSGIATQTRHFVDAIAGTSARIYDTRKTTPGWRRLEKYAVRCGGGTNHRSGLFDAVLIKDNHLAISGLTPGEAVRRARQFVAAMFPSQALDDPAAPETTQPRDPMIVEIEVDTLEQLENVLPQRPDVVLLDNMTLDQLRAAVACREAAGAATELEASGGVDLSTVRGIAETGVQRISVGALTHSAVSLDVGLDWIDWPTGGESR